MKVLSSQVEEQENIGAVAQRRTAGFGVALPQPAAAGGFGRRQTPLPSTTDGAPPRAAANDRDAEDFEPQAAHVTPGGHALPIAMDDFSNELLGWLKDELRRGKSIQHEAVLCALGSLAGYAAQQAIRETLVKSEKMSLDQAFVVIETRSGEVFFFGDLLNDLILDKHGLRGDGTVSIWKVVSEGGYEAGAINLPDVTDMIKHCAATVGHEEFGIPRVPDTHMPELLPREALSRFWHAARRRLAGTDPMSWPVQFALAASKLVVELKDEIRPDIAVQIVMEAAVPMSKIDPVTLPKD
jgi:hypothetical protein